MAKKINLSVHLFNCDNTIELDSVESLFTPEVRNKVDLNISIEKHYFSLNQMSEMSDNIVPGLQIDLAVFVVHAHESRLSINEDDAGIGYAKIYRALKRATGDNVIIVIGGDDNYEDDGEENRVVLSRWSKRKISSQFNEEYLDGRKSFIFSWNKQHREIHEEALVHYFDPSKKGQKFEYQPKPKPVPLPIREKPDVTPQAAGGTQQKFVEVDRELLVPSDENEDRERAISDRDGQTRELMSQQGEARYGTITDYPAGTVLLETIMRYGEISYQVQDVVKREDEWQPSDRNKARLKEENGLIPKAKVTFVSEGNGAISWKVAKEKVAEEIPWWRKCMIRVVASAAACWAGFTRCMRAAWAWIYDFVRRRCRCRC